MDTFLQKNILCLVTLALMFATVCVARELSDEDLHRLPKLFHLDDYERCLSQKDGIYCVGTFELIPKIAPNLEYDIITERLNQHFSFDRRLLHRGYCLSETCQSEEQNTTLRFEQCADRLLRNQALTARLKKLSYCITYAERKAKQSEGPDLPQRIFLYVVYFILILNVLGTVHDVFGDGKKNKHLMAWSIPANWRVLTTIEDGDSIFAPLQSSKIILHCLIIYTHANLLHFMFYMYNPEAVEKTRDSFLNVLIRNGTSLVQVFILISSFFTGYNTLETSRRSAVGPGLVAKWILKRIFRLAPVYLLLTAYSATWWPRNGDGPLWSPIVEAESKVCRNKFWTHVLFINNFVEPSELCMVQSWAMAAEVQLFLVSLLVTLLLIKLRVRAVPVLGAMFAASCLFNVTLAYVAGLVPMVKVIVPETLRTEFRGSRSFFHLHTSPWSNFPACLFGLLIAHVYFEQKNKVKAKIEDNTEIINGSIRNGIKHENGCLVNGNSNLEKEKDLRLKENSVFIKENGVCVKENGVCIKDNGVYVKENGVCIKDNGVYVKENGVCNKENGVYVKENGVCNKENSVHNKENCVEIKENGVRVKENSVCTKGYGLRVKENEVYIKENGLRVKENGVYNKENGVSVKANGVPIKENGLHVNENSVHVNENGVHVIDNALRLNENSVQVKENSVRSENGLKHRMCVANDIKSNGIKRADNIYEHKSNGVINGVINQNGQSKLSERGQQNGVSIENKDKKRAPFLLRYAHCFTFPALIVWVVLGSRVAAVESAPLIALYVGLERLMFSLTFACQVFQIITVKGPWARLLSWRGWVVPARLVLSVAMVHWCVNATMVAARPQPVASSLLYVSIDWLATLLYSYVIALPISILVELPMKRALDALIA